MLAGARGDQCVWIALVEFAQHPQCMQADQTAQHKQAITLLSKHCVGARDSSSLS